MSLVSKRIDWPVHGEVPFLFQAHWANEPFLARALLFLLWIKSKKTVLFQARVHGELACRWSVYTLSLGKMQDSPEVSRS